MSNRSKDKWDISFEDYFYYDTSSTTYLRNKVNRWRGKYKNILAASVGDVAGWSDDGGYSWVQLGSKSYQTHGIVYILHYGKIPDGMFVDHIDGDKQNNIIENLRLVSRAGNQRNRKLNKNSKTGVCGVEKIETYVNGVLREAYRASAKTISGNRKSRHFSVGKYGDEEAFRLACEHRQKMIDELNAQGAGYTERHGN